jgi:3-deoxy-D-manno-octulosonic-acid transferase
MPWGQWFSNLLSCFTHIFVQDEESAKLLEKKDFRKFTIVGDTRFDRVAAIAKSSKDIPIVEKFAGQKPLLIAGSTWKPDEELLARFINETNAIKLVIAPHEVTPENVNKLEKLLKKPSVRFSLADPLSIHKSEVLIIDTMGILSSLYRYGKIAYIGGGFGVGIHNILEASTFGLPVIFGPKYQKFREARDLVRLNAAIAVKDYTSLHQILTELLTNTSKLEEMSVTSKNYVKKNRGATQKIIHQIFQ